MRLILVEDEPLIALDLEILAASAGHQVVGVAESFPDALDLLATYGPEAALVDLNLRDGLTGLDVARQLTDRGVTVAFVTGNAEQIPEDFSGAVAIMEKPFTEEGVIGLLGMMQTVRAGGSLPPV